MNLIDAVKSGKKFKRPLWGEYYYSDSDISFVIGRLDILATDYFIEPEPEQTVTITKAELERAFAKWSICFCTYCKDHKSDHICKEIGFK